MHDMTCQQKTVLICDDADDIVNLLSYVLTNAGYAVQTAHGHDEFKLQLQDRQPDAVILDIQMPERNGFWIAEDMQICGRNIPIIFITAHNKPLYKLYASALGAVDFMLKPLDIDALLVKVEQATRNPGANSGFMNATPPQ